MQGISQGPRLPANGRSVDMTGPAQQQRPQVLSSQQKNPGQDQNLQRPLGQPQLNVSDPVSAAVWKCSSCLNTYDYDVF